MNSILSLDHKDWLQEDLDYSPKRRVDNKFSWEKPHIIGSFKSRKMKRTIEYHSLNECLFYYFLEVDPDVVRYYVQPVEVPIPIAVTKTFNKFWLHVPDVLVFRNGQEPLLYQIKEASGDLGETFKRCNEYCELMAQHKKWKYDVIYPKTLPPIVLQNIVLLQGDLRERPEFAIIKNDVMFKIKLLDSVSIEEFSGGFYPSHPPAAIKPLLFHLIATGELETDMYQKINNQSLIRRKVCGKSNNLSQLYQTAFGDQK